MNQLVEIRPVKLPAKKGARPAEQATDGEILEYMYDLTTSLLAMGARFNLVCYFLCMARMEMVDILEGRRKPKV